MNGNVQDELTSGLISIFFKAPQNMLKNYFDKCIKEYQEFKRNKKQTNQQHKTNIKSHGKMSMEEFMQMDGQKETIVVSDLKEFEKKAKEYGIGFAVKSRPVYQLDANGKALKDEKGKPIPVMDYSECKLKKDEKGDIVYNYEKCRIVKDEYGHDVMGDDGKPKLEEGSPLPVPELEEGSKKAQPMMEYTIFFKAENQKVLTECFKDYIDGEEKKKQKIQDRYEKKQNIKEMIKKNKEKMGEVNKDNPEKHHNRGEQSL